MQSLNKMFADLEFMNECGDRETICTFSDPDGVRSGKSGWSFGESQFDTQNNDAALSCLKECGFTEEEIKGIVSQTVDVTPFAERLKANADIIERYDIAQFSHCLNSAMSVITEHGLPIENPNGILALADYVNQYGSIGPGFIKWLGDLKRTVIGADILNFKLLNTKYGKERPADCKRRYNNLLKVVREANAA